jgi:hypothetical protein
MPKGKKGSSASKNKDKAQNVISEEKRRDIETKIQKSMAHSQSLTLVNCGL